MESRFKPSAHDHVQSEASAVWTITHGLPGAPSVQVSVDYEGVLQVILPKSIEYGSEGGVVTITFSRPFTGVARLV